MNYQTGITITDMKWDYREVSKTIFALSVLFEFSPEKSKSIQITFFLRKKKLHCKAPNAIMKKSLTSSI